jgi:hypothetical protein
LESIAYAHRNWLCWRWLLSFDDFSEDCELFGTGVCENWKLAMMFVGRPRGGELN